MTWSSKIYVATQNAGVYYTSNFSDPAIQPTWTAINDGLTNLDCLEFHLDPFDNEYRQYVLIDSENTLYRRENGESWTTILNLSIVAALTGGTGKLIRGFWADQSVEGRLWATVYADLGAWHQQFIAIYSDDYGDTWHMLTPFYDSFAAYNLYNVRSYGDIVWAGGRYAGGAYTYAPVSINKSASWLQKFTYFNALMCFNPLLPNQIYTNGSASGKLSSYSSGGIETGLQSTLSIARYDSMWFNVHDSQHQRLIYNQKIYVTDDGWATINTPSTVSNAPFAFSPWAGTDTNEMLVALATGDHVIGALYGEDDITPNGIAGTSASVAPYTDSIPNTCGGICQAGLQAVGFTIGQVFTNAVAMKNYEGNERGIPIQGDRGAWDSLNYPVRHTNDIDMTVGIHHTLGTESGQAASGDHTHDFIDNLGELIDVHVPNPQDGDVLMWSEISGSWLAIPMPEWKLELIQDTSGSNSNKAFVVPTGNEWQILWVSVDYTSSSVVGTRQLEVRVQDSASTILAQQPAGITQDEDLTYKYLFGIALPDMTTLRDGNNLTTSLGGGTFLMNGEAIRVWDNKAIDPNEDNMSVNIRYAYRTTSVPAYFIISAGSGTQTQVAGSPTLIP